jgi:hypothetical protein
MKKLLYPIAFTLTAFLILYSCSAEEEDTTPPPSIIQTPEPEPPAQNQNSIYNVKKSLVNINVANERDLDHVTELFGPMGISSSIVYQNETGTYLLAPGVVTCFNGECNNVDSALEIVPSSSYLMKKEIGDWKLHKKLDNLSTWGIRNTVLKDDFFVLGDGNEIGNNWKGHLWFGEIIDSEIKINKISTDETASYFHCVAMGDLNNDGLLDLGGAPGRDSGENGAMDYIIYLQTSKNNFELLELNSFIEYTNERYEMSNFSINFSDLDNDNVDEIIVCGKYLSVLSFNEQNNKFEVVWNASHESLYPEVSINDSFWGTSIKVADFNNDGIKDISIAREGLPHNGIGQTTFEVWIGNGDKAFEPRFVQKYPDSKFMFREFELLDVNNDSFIDIVLRTNGLNSGAKSSEYQIDVNDIRKGIKIDELIWINDGTGHFNKYFQEDFNLEGVYPRKLIPYIENNELHLVGSIKNVVQEGNGSIDIEFFDITLTIQ